MSCLEALLCQRGSRGAALPMHNKESGGWLQVYILLPAASMACGARSSQGQRREMALSVPRARTCESNLPPDEEYGRDGRTRCAAEIRSATYILAQASVIIRCFKRKRAHFYAPGSLWTRLR